MSGAAPQVRHQWHHLAARRQARPSRLDILDKESPVHQTFLIGLYRLTHMVAGVWMVTSPICMYYETGHFVDRELFAAAFSNVGLLFTTWLYAVIYSFSGYGLHVLHGQQNWPRWTIKALLYLDTTILMSSCLTIVRAVNWSVYPSVFIMSVAVIHFMKIHSFVDTSLYISKIMEESTITQKIEKAAGEKGHHNNEEDQNVLLQASINTTPDSEQNENLAVLRNNAAAAAAAPAAAAPVERPSMSFPDFAKFLITPRLVYEPEWPKAPHGFRLKYFALKFVFMLSTLALIFLVSANFVMPVMKRAHKTTYIHTFAGLIVPLFLLDLLFFYVMFECILNLLAELVGYGDRDFYQDWWNSTTWEEFARKWNYPVHEFLLRHIYLPIYTTKDLVVATAASAAVAGAASTTNTSSTSASSTAAIGASGASAAGRGSSGLGSSSSDVQRKWVASTVTILYSAVIHEFFLAATLGFVSWYMIIIMLCQLPLFALSRYHRNTTFGNIFFCLGISIGVPFIAMLYGTDWSAKYYNTD